MIDAHIHCAECFREIATQLKVAGGKTKDREIKMGVQMTLGMTPQGPQAVQRGVPICDDCWDKIEKQEQAARAASKLIVPTLRGVPQ